MVPEHLSGILYEKLRIFVRHGHLSETILTHYDKFIIEKGNGVDDDNNNV